MRKLLEYLKVGRILGSHGVHGAFKIELFSKDPERLQYLSEARLVDPQNPANFFATKLSLQGRKASSCILSAWGIDSREAVKQYRNWYIEVPREAACHLAEGEYFICDLIGCEVYDSERGYLGKVKEVLQNTVQDVFVISNGTETDILLPRVNDNFVSFDIEKGLIQVQLPQGLYEVYR